MQFRIIESHLNLEYLEKYSSGEIFIETGTYMGDTIWLALEFPKFKKIYSSEINNELYERAVKLFDHKEQVRIVQGESSEVITYALLEEENKTATFWLDAHASGPLGGGKHGGTPLLYELEAIKKSGNKEHTIFIDDRRLFGSAEWNEVKEEDAMKIIMEINPNYNIHLLDGHIEKDIICATVRD